MFGFVIGMACLAGMAMMFRHRRYQRYGYGYGGGYGRGCGPGRFGGGPRGYHGHGGEGGGWEPGYGGGRFGGRRGWGPLGMLISRLEATPEQERLIRGELEQLFEQASGLKREMRLSKDDVAKAMRADSLDEEVMGESFARQDEQIEEVRKAFVGALARIHDVLDDRQRRRLAEMMERGGMPWRW
ncbi:MAG: hypothetical protein AAF721_09490 [Myxococcota bacterium]